MSKYYHITDNEEIEIDINDFKLQCCSCGLTHRIIFRKKGNQLFAKFSVDKKATGQIRRHKK